jgi:hypothetical protein
VIAIIFCTFAYSQFASPIIKCVPKGFQPTHVRLCLFLAANISISVDSVFAPFTNTETTWIEIKTETVDLILEDRMFPASDTPESGCRSTVKFEKVFTVDSLDRFKKSRDDFDLLVRGPFPKGYFRAKRIPSGPGHWFTRRLATP